MLRRIPSTPLVCLAIYLTTVLWNNAWASDPNKSLEILLKPNQATTTAPVTAAAKPKAVGKSKAKATTYYTYDPYLLPPPPPPGITKVKPLAYKQCFGAVPCILPTPRQGQWEMGAQALFARTKGAIAWPRYSIYWYSWNQGWDNKTDFNTMLKLPDHNVLTELSARYQFRPNWAARYEVLFDEINGGGYADEPFVFGPWWSGGYFYGQQINTQWQHAYHRVSLVYDAIKTCQSAISVSAGWVHVDDKISINCWACGQWSNTFSKSIDAMIAGLEFQRCVKTAANGGTFSFDHKASVIFLDDVEGYDVEAAGRFSVPLNCGRWGYVKGGYRFVQLKKSQTDYLLNNTIEGGFVEGGFIF